MELETLIRAYREELAGYRRRGLHDRAALVEESLRRLGVSTGVTPRENVRSGPASTIAEDAARDAETPPNASKPAPAPRPAKSKKPRP